MAVIAMKSLLESGVHFGHRTHKWHPAMKPYIFTERNGIHIIDLQKTVKALEQSYGLVRDTVAAGGNVLFIGTKRQAQDTVRDEAIRAGMPYVTVRWLGGMLTNWRTIRQRIERHSGMRVVKHSSTDTLARGVRFGCSSPDNQGLGLCPRQPYFADAVRLFEGEPPLSLKAAFY